MKQMVFCLILLLLIGITSSPSKLSYHDVPGSFFRKVDLGFNPTDSLIKQRCEICELDAELSAYKKQVGKN